tara:strand:+ start:1445 stop:2509 length:1065 start_codon:yes stop_codon:yes gene_type:complete
MQGIKKDIELENEIRKISASSGGGAQDVQVLEVQGTTDATTAVASYGINIIETVTASDFCCRLPEAKTGKEVIFINKTQIPVNVFPSAPGGDINGNVDGSASLSVPYTPYSFYCTVNPLPGSWVLSSPLATAQIGIPNLDTNTGVAANYLEIPHTNGVLTKAAGWETGSFKLSPAGLGVQSGGPSGCGYLFGNSSNAPTYMRSETTPTKIVKLKLYSNILISDIPSPWTGPGYPVVFQISSSFLIGCNGGTSTSWYYNYINTPDSFDPSNYSTELTTGISNTPLQVGDLGTLYNELSVGVNTPTSNNPHYGQIGSNIGLVPGGGSDYWWCPYFEISAGMPTKDYQFKIILEVNQ